MVVLSGGIILCCQLHFPAHSEVTAQPDGAGKFEEHVFPMRGGIPVNTAFQRSRERCHGLAPEDAGGGMHVDAHDFLTQRWAPDFAVKFDFG